MKHSMMELKSSSACGLIVSATCPFGMYLSKQLFDSKVKTDFLTYLKDKGLYLENLKDKYSRWHYCGIVAKDDVYRIQYYEEDDD